MPHAPQTRNRSRPRKKCTSEDKGVIVEASEGSSGVDFKAHNSTARFVHVVVQTTGNNLANNSEPKQRLLSPCEGNADLGGVWAANRAEPWSYKWEWSMTFDDPFAVHDDSIEYRLPFDISKRLYCCQGVNGSFSHKGCWKHAVDWKAKEGTPIFAARGGQVTNLQDGSQESGPLPEYKDMANFVSITHADHTVGEYLHLKYKGVVVQLGDFVEAGQLIGYSGNTGWSTTPHIHFHVFKSILYDLRRPEGDKFHTIPVRFVGCPWVPKQGDWCPPIIALSEVDGKEVCKTPEQDPDKEYRSNGLVIYQYARGEAALELRVHNENESHARLQVMVTGTNVEFSRPVPINDIVPSLTERFLMRVERTAQSTIEDSVWEWNFQFKFVDVEASDLGCRDDCKLLVNFDMFLEIDLHENGFIDKNEYWNWLNSFCPDLTAADVDSLWAGMDTNSNGIVEFAEFLEAVLQKRHKPTRKRPVKSGNCHEAVQLPQLQAGANIVI